MMPPSRNCCGAENCEITMPFKVSTRDYLPTNGQLETVEMETRNGKQKWSKLDATEC